MFVAWKELSLLTHMFYKKQLQKQEKFFLIIKENIIELNVIISYKQNVDDILRKNI